MKSAPDPAYLALHRSGELADRAREAQRHLEDCDLCARYCHVDRLEGMTGAVCRTGKHAVVHSFGPHLGEENPLRGWRGSGTIFFSWCNLRCAFCQNWEISQRGVGRETGPEELAAIMVGLQEAGCHNINFVSPSHVVAQILEALPLAVEEGLRLPLVYNTGGYDSPEALELLDGVIDIYMPDVKFGDPKAGRVLSTAKEYPKQNREAVREMHRQTGDLMLDADGLARRGVLVRHLVLPGHLNETKQILSFLAKEISPNTYLNLMDQYHPCYRADEHPPLDRPLTRKEFQSARAMAVRLGLTRLGSIRGHR